SGIPALRVDSDDRVDFLLEDDSLPLLRFLVRGRLDREPVALQNLPEAVPEGGRLPLPEEFLVVGLILFVKVQVLLFLLPEEELVVLGGLRQRFLQAEKLVELEITLVGEGLSLRRFH